jgi:hypothetical protein
MMIPSNDPSRRSILGTLGAAALAGIAGFPWRPKPTDLVIATELPQPSPALARYRELHPAMADYQDLPDVTPGATLYDHRGRAVAVVTGGHVDYQSIDVTTIRNPQRPLSVPTLMTAVVHAELTPPFRFRTDDGRLICVPIQPAPRMPSPVS